jgi:O-antigen/teichoic acid export membrane protein
MLELETLGQYMLAYTAASAILIIQLGISSAMFPAFTEVFEQHGRDSLAKRYVSATQVTLFMVGMVAFPLIFFGKAILTLWVGSDAASSSWYLLSLLTIGFYFSSASTNAYVVTIACRATKLPLKINLFIILPYLFTLYFSIMWMGAEGAAFVWIFLNVLYVLILVPLVHREILGISFFAWFVGILLRFLVLGAGVFGAAKWVWLTFFFEVNGSTAIFIQYGLLMLALCIYVSLGFFMLDEKLQFEVKKMMKNVFILLRNRGAKL